MMTYLYNILLWLDEGLNVFIVGLIVIFLTKPVPAMSNAHYTVSQVLAELRERGNSFGCIGCKVLTKVWGLWIRTPNYDHCTAALLNADGTPVNENEVAG